MSDPLIQAHNERPAAVWSSGGEAYEIVSRQNGSALEHCVARLDPKPGEEILDLATGTGWTSRLVARRGASVVGADIASDLLAAAKQHASKEGLNIEYRIGDAEKLPFADQSFNGVVSTFGVMFASRPEVAAAELGRVSKQGGRIALATWLPDSSVSKMFQVMRTSCPRRPTQPRRHLSNGVTRIGCVSCYLAISISSSRRASLPTSTGTVPGHGTHS